MGQARHRKGEPSSDGIAHAAVLLAKMRSEPAFEPDPDDDARLLGEASVLHGSLYPRGWKARIGFIPCFARLLRAMPSFTGEGS
jgi:hypothetical protein